MNDISEISQLVLHERQGRDRGLWEQMDACFHPDSLVHLSWFHGSGADFVAQSSAKSGGGILPVHRCSPPVVNLRGMRAVVELPLSAEVRMPISGVEVDLVSAMRLLYQVEQRDSTWKILVMNCIYERDTLTPSLPGVELKLDKERLAQFRMPFRCLAYQFSLRGIMVPNDLYGDDQPDRVKALYAQAKQWLAE